MESFCCYRKHTIFTLNKTFEGEIFSQSVMSDSVAPWTVACQALLCMEFSRQEYWSGLLVPSPGDLPDPGIELRFSTLWAESLPSVRPGNKNF